MSSAFTARPCCIVRRSGLPCRSVTPQRSREAIRIPVMHDFRAADVAAGGQGAPFVPVYHRALARSLDRPGPIVVVNIGGVSNITYIDGVDPLIACDTGPGNALLDDFMLARNRPAVRRRRPLAAQGQPDDDGWHRARWRIRSSSCRRRNRSTATISLR